jgi:hypothetical protein
MYWGGLERLGLSLAWKPGFHLVTLAHFTNIFTTFPKLVFLGPMYGHEGTLPSIRLCYYAICMYWGGSERLGLQLALKQGLHWVTLAQILNLAWGNN